MKANVIAATLLAGAACFILTEGEASAQIPPSVERDPNWDTVSSVSLAIGVASAALMPRVYYASPDATVGWKARWHVSALAPIMTMTSLTLMMDGPVKEAIQTPKAGCTVDDTLARFTDSGCETFGMPSTHSFASWGAFGASTSIFLVDAFNHSDSQFSAPALLGNVIVPFGAAIMTSVSRSADGRGLGPEPTDQVLAGAATGLVSGAVLGLGYALMQEPDCGYGGYLFCW